MPIKNKKDSDLMKVKGDEFNKRVVAVFKKILPYLRDKIFPVEINRNGEDILYKSYDSRMLVPLATETRLKTSTKRGRGYSNVFTDFKDAIAHATKVNQDKDLPIPVYPAVCIGMEMDGRKLMVLDLEDLLTLLTQDSRSVLFINHLP